MLAVLIGAAVAFATTQDGPPLPINYLHPTGGHIEASFTCAGRAPEERTTYSLEFGYERVRIVSYSSAWGSASADDLALLNSYLEPIRAVVEHRFDCQGDGERLVIGGIDRHGGGTASLLVTWRDGKMEALPSRYGGRPRIQ